MISISQMAPASCPLRRIFSRDGCHFRNWLAFFLQPLLNRILEVRPRYISGWHREPDRPHSPPFRQAVCISFCLLSSSFFLFSLSLSLSLSLYLPIGVFWEKTLRQRLNSIVTRRVNQKINFTPSETERIRRRPTLRSRVSLSDSVSGWTGFEWIFSLGKTRNWVERLIIKPEEWFNTREFDYFKSFSSRFFDRTVILQHLVLQNDPL